MLVENMLRKYLLIIVLLAFLSSVGMVVLHHHEDKSTADICQICDFANIHFSQSNADILIAIDYLVIPMLIIFFSSYKYRLDNIFRNKAPPYLTV
jgi:hypothetical protein